jgi:branched-subunit amino acid ABC-type transport system permease component
MLASAILTGLGLGSMYGLLALGFYITYAVSSTVNFAQGSSMMLGAVFAYTFAVNLGWPLLPAAALALALCALYGVIVELVAVRPFARRGSNAWLMATVALGIVADNTVLFTFGKEPRGFPMPFTARCSWQESMFPICSSRYRPSAFRSRRRSAPSHEEPGTARRCWRWCRTRMRRG